MVVVGTSGIPNDPATTNIKKQLSGLGVGEERMGYDKSTGSIKVDGQNIVNNPNKGISSFAATTNQNPYSTMSNYQNPYDNQMNDALTQYIYALRNPRQYTTQDAMNTAQYNAAQANIARQSHQATRQAQESLGGARLGRSSVLADRAQNIQNEESNYLNTQAIPHIIQQLQAQDQQQVNNLQNILSAISQQQNLYDNRYNDAFSRSVTEAGLTGRFMPQGAEDIISQLLSLKQEAERPDLGAETYAAYKAEGDKLRNQLIAMGIDPSFISSDVTSGQAAQNIPSAFATMDARNQQFNQNMAQQQFDLQNMETMAQLTGFMPDGRPTTAQQQRDLQNAWATIDALGYVPENLSSIVGIPPGTRTQAAIQQAIQNQFQQQQIAISSRNADTSAFNARQSANNADFNRLMTIWESTGKAPEGLANFGITPGSPYPSGQTSGTTSIDAKSSADNYNIVRGDIDEASNYQEALILVQSNRDNLSDSDYRKLLDYVNEHWR